MKIVLIGFATSYKSTVGKLLSEKMQLPWWDVDFEVEKCAGKTIAEIFAEKGEAHFRQMESDVLCQLAEKQGIISCGGGSVLSAEFPKLAQNATVVWLKTSAQSVKSRIKKGVRPLFDELTVEELQQKIDVREAHYKRFATHCVVTDEKSSEQVADEVVSILKTICENI